MSHRLCIWRTKKLVFLVPQTAGIVPNSLRVFFQPLVENLALLHYELISQEYLMNQGNLALIQNSIYMKRIEKVASNMKRMNISNWQDNCNYLQLFFLVNHGHTILTSLVYLQLFILMVFLIFLNH